MVCYHSSNITLHDYRMKSKVIKKPEFFLVVGEKTSIRYYLRENHFLRTKPYPTAKNAFKKAKNEPENALLLAQKIDVLRQKKLF